MNRLIVNLLVLLIPICGMFTVLKNDKKQIVTTKKAQNLSAEVNRCADLFNQEHYESALECNTKLKEEYPENIVIVYNYALSLLYNGKIDESIKFFEYIVKNGNENKKVTEGSTYFLKKLAEMKRLDAHDIGDYFVDIDKYSIWENPQEIKVYIYDEHQKGQLLKEAFNNWDNSLYGMVNFVYVDDPQKAKITAKATSQKAVAKVCNMPSAVGCAAHRTYKYKKNPKQNYIYDVKVVVAIDFDDKPVTDKYFYAVALHEIGHALGIQSHSPNIADAMYPNTGSYAQRRGKITNRDINTVKRIYGNI